MRVHVIVASRHDGTREIANRIAATLRERGLDAEVTRLELDGGPVIELAPDDAVVLGSAVYAGEWMGRARHFVDEHGLELREHPLWLFSSGARHGAEGAELERAWVEHVTEATSPLGHHVFLGRIDTTRLSFGERFVAANRDLPVGDFREWDDVTAWANEIADALAAAPNP